MVLSTKFAFLCVRSPACELRLKDTVEDVEDLLPEWIAVLDAYGGANTWESNGNQLNQLIVGMEKKYEDLLVNIKKHHCCEYISAKLKSWNHTCLFQPYRSGYKMMWSNELRQREYVKAI